MPLFTNLVTEDDLRNWTLSGTAAVTLTTGLLGATDAYRVASSDSADAITRDLTLTSLSTLVQCVLIIKETNATANISVVDTASQSPIVAFSVIAWTTGTMPTLDVTSGSLTELDALGGNWWKITLTQTTTSLANAIQIIITPPEDSSVDVYKVNVFNSSTVPSRFYAESESAYDGWDGLTTPGTTTWIEVFD